MKIKGDGFILRHVRLADAGALFECEQDKEARKNFMSTPKYVGEKSYRAYASVKNNERETNDLSVEDVRGLISLARKWLKELKG